MSKLISVGKILNFHGIKGEVKMGFTAGKEDLISKLDKVFLYVDNVKKTYDVVSVRFHKNFALIKVKGIDDINMAERFKGSFLELPREDLKPLPEGRYYICDLIGLKVIDEILGELGNITEVIETVSNDVYVVNYKGKELCIPVLEDVVHDVDLDNLIVRVTLPKGLI
jgi:16S rRNA processing protein RimM